MQFQDEKHEAEILERLRRLAPSASELWQAEIDADPDNAKLIFKKIVADTPLSEIVELEETDPYLISLHKARETDEDRRAIARAKAAGLKPANHGPWA